MLSAFAKTAPPDVPPSIGTALAPTCTSHIEIESGSTMQNIFVCLAATTMFKDYSFEELRIGDNWGWSRW
jgi:hypothetical protein